MFRPRLSDQEIKDEALRLLHRAKLLREKELERERQAEQEVWLYSHQLQSSPASVRVSLCCHEGFKYRHITRLLIFHNHTDIYTECSHYIYMPWVWTHVYVCVCKIKKEIPVETNKGKKASVIPKNNKVPDSPKPEILTESPDPDDIQPGYEFLFCFTFFLNIIHVPACFVIMTSLLNWHSSEKK